MSFIPSASVICSSCWNFSVLGDAASPCSSATLIYFASSGLRAGSSAECLVRIVIVSGKVDNEFPDYFGVSYFSVLFLHLCTVFRKVSLKLWSKILPCSQHNLGLSKVPSLSLLVPLYAHAHQRMKSTTSMPVQHRKQRNTKCGRAQESNIYLCGLHVQYLWFVCILVVQDNVQTWLIEKEHLFTMIHIRIIL